MAAPRGDSREGLNAGFSGFTALEGNRGAQEGFDRSHTSGFGLDVDSTSNSLHSGLEPSILSLFEDTSTTGEPKNRIDEESEATLLSALSEILDSVIEDTLSPFDTIPDAELFVGQRNHDSKFRRASDKEAGPWVTRSQRSSLSNSKVEGLLSDRQLRPRVHHRVQTATVQRSDGEEEELSEIRRCPVRTFRIESDPELSQDEQQDGVLVSLVDLIRHMHPYSLRVDLLKEEKTREAREPQEEDVFVDVVGDDESEDALQGISGFSPRSQCDLVSEQRAAAEAPKSKTGLGKQTSGAGQKEKLKMCSSGDGGQNRDDICRQKPQKSILATMGHARVKKKVCFAPDLTSVYEYQAECDWSDTLSSEDNKTPDSDSEAVTSDENPTEASTKTACQHGIAKHKSISLQEYRLLKRKALPKEERKMDYKTKWPSIPEPPRELPAIPSIPGYSPPQVNPRTSFANAKSSPSGSPTKPKRNPHPLSQPKQTAIQPVDPPNPVLVPLPKPAPTPVKTSEEQSIKQQKSAASHPTHLNLQLQAAASQTSGAQDVVSVGGSPVSEVPPPKCSSAIMATTKARVSAPSLPMRGRPSQESQRRLPLVRIPAVIRDHHCAEEQSRASTDEIGIQATDVTSLLEQFETQGLTPPATPPHQIWKPLVSGHRAKQHEAIKPSSSKAIQIIEPRPLPPNKVHSKPQLFTSVPAPSLSLAFRDHDYCGTQGNKDRSERSFTATDVPRKSLKVPRSHISHKALDHRTFCEEERLPGSVLLSPESSPSRLDESSVGLVEEAEAQRSSRHTSCSPSPTRGRTRRRHYRGRYHHSDSSSVSSSSSPSCSSSASSSSSRSPPRKRRRSRRSSESSTSSSSRSSSSLSPSPVRSRQRYCSRSSRSCSRSCSGSRSRSYSRSRSRSYSRSRSRSHSPESNWRLHRERKRKAALRLRKQKAIEERRVVYVGRIRDSMTQDELRDRFAQFGKIEDCTLHFRMHGDNYAFVTFYNKKDAFTAIERGTKLRQPDELPFDICFGGRRQFCQSDYADLDSNRDTDSTPEKSRCDALDFDTLLKQAQRGVRR